MALVRKYQYSWLRLPSPSVFPVYQVNGTCSSVMCKFEALIFLESCRVSCMVKQRQYAAVMALLIENEKCRQLGS